MSTIVRIVRNFVRDEEGAAAVEYALMIGAIAVIVVTAVKLLGTNVNARFNAGATALS